MASLFIYALREPSDGSIFYVGKAKNPATRYRCHFKSARLDTNRFLCERVRRMKESGGRPILTILEVCDEQSWRIREREWIAFFRSIGVSLDNIAAGGDGSTVGHRGPFKDTDQRRIRIRKVWRDWWDSLTPEQKSIEQKKKMTAKAKEKMSADRKGIPQTEIHKNAVIASKRTPEFHAKASASQKLVWAAMSPKRRAEIISKRRLSTVKAWASMNDEARSRRLHGLILGARKRTA